MLDSTGELSHQLAGLAGCVRETLDINIIFELTSLLVQQTMAALIDCTTAFNTSAVKQLHQQDHCKQLSIPVGYNPKVSA